MEGWRERWKEGMEGKGGACEMETGGGVIM